MIATQWQPGVATVTRAPKRAIRVVVLTVLAVDGVLCAVVGAMLLPSYIGSVPFPISAVLSGPVNAALVWAAGHWTSSPRLAALPLWTWLLTVVAMTLGVPADDVIFGGRGVLAYAALLLIVFGAIPPVWVVWRLRSSEARADEALRWLRG